MVYENNHTITKYTSVLEFQHGTLQNLFWKSFGCDSCSRDSICLNKQDCAVPNSKCKRNGGLVDCTLAIQLTFSSTDKNLEALNSCTHFYRGVGSSYINSVDLVLDFLLHFGRIGVSCILRN
ncbi:hypothetical protein LWI28_027200 [Acer negundo]|uniref:Uncharacterized protein n=1 Tax=Acer negundo TaxID=4023 RepID=A0AAD5J766_ACENE|nr:hypothetical protein LWI28_027200 [Acer negundo]